MTEYKSLKNYKLESRGLRVFLVKNDKNRKNFGDKDGLIGSTVKIDGKEYRVEGVEAFALPEILEGATIGLAVKI